MANSNCSGIDRFILSDMRTDESHLYFKEASRLGQGYTECF
jgi:hypothetical protein